MNFGEYLRLIATGFERARTEAFKSHSLAKSIRHGWPQALIDLLAVDKAKNYSFEASPGLGQWSEAPWLAVLSPKVTSSAMVGFYPVYLFEPGFENVCLVLGQGAQRLEDAVGRKSAGQELAKRAALLREHGGDWRSAGFSEGPFLTRKSAAVTRTGKVVDPWTDSAAFGIRYKINDLPSNEILAADLIRMLNLYDGMVSKPILRFPVTDDDLLNLKESGELPKGSVDGAKRVVNHRKFEKRTRNRKLIAEVKKLMGCSCQACGFNFGTRYGDHMSGFIEAHHTVPIMSLPKEGANLQPNATDFMVLCSNCHRAIHRAGCPTLDVFKASFSNDEKGTGDAILA